MTYVCSHISRSEICIRVQRLPLFLLPPAASRLPDFPHEIL